MQLQPSADRPPKWVRLGAAPLLAVCIWFILSALGGQFRSQSADAQPSFSVEVLHVVPVGVQPTSDIDVRAAATIDAVQTFLIADIGRTLRVTPGVTQVIVNDGGLDQIRNQLAAQGFDDENTIYLSFADSRAANTACGEASGNYAFLWMPVCDIYPSYPPVVWPYGASYLVLHELLHTLGAVPTCAPNAVGSHAGDSNRDVLYSGPLARDWDNLTIDLGRDDYYGHNMPDCPDTQDSAFWAPVPRAIAPTPSSPACPPAEVTIDMTSGASGRGTPGDDVILGTPGPDKIDGLGGNDRICAGGGDDLVNGGPGDDMIWGEDGNDRLLGQQGRDEIMGGAGDDIVHGNRGDDRLFGQAGADRIFGYADNDLISGGADDDRLHGNFGDDTLWGQDGDDRLFGYGDDDEIIGGLGHDLLAGNFGEDRLLGGDGDDTAYGSDGTDWVAGGPGNDTLAGNSGTDTVVGGTGNDSLDGGINSDSCFGGPGTDTVSRCENITGVP